MTEPVRQPWEARLVTDVLPAGAVPTAALWMPVAGRALRNSPDDVVGLTREQVRSRLPGGDNMVISICADDLADHVDADHDDAELRRLVASTDGGVIVVGVTYELKPRVRVHNQVCPECGSGEAELLGPPDDHVAPGLRAAANLYGCPDCDTAWDA